MKCKYERLCKNILLGLPFPIDIRWKKKKKEVTSTTKFSLSGDSEWRTKVFCVFNQFAKTAVCVINRIALKQ